MNFYTDNISDFDGTAYYAWYGAAGHHTKLIRSISKHTKSSGAKAEAENNHRCLFTSQRGTGLIYGHLISRLNKLLIERRLVKNGLQLIMCDSDAS